MAIGGQSWEEPLSYHQRDLPDTRCTYLHTITSALGTASQRPPSYSRRHWGSHNKQENFVKQWHSTHASTLALPRLHAHTASFQGPGNSRIKHI